MSEREKKLLEVANCMVDLISMAADLGCQDDDLDELWARAKEAERTNCYLVKSDHQILILEEKNALQAQP